MAIDTLDDMLALFDGINLEQVSVSMTINAPAIVVMAFYLAAAEERGFDWHELRGTIQNDILKEFHSQNEFVFPPEPSVRLVCDVIEFCARNVPQWNPVSISGYHIREAGSTAAQELAFTLADGFHYVDQCLARGMAIDDFAPRLVVLLQCTQRPVRRGRQVPCRAACCGPTRCATVMVQRIRHRGNCDATPRPRVARSRTNSPR